MNLSEKIYPVPFATKGRLERCLGVPCSLHFDELPDEWQLVLDSLKQKTILRRKYPSSCGINILSRVSAKAFRLQPILMKK